MSIIYNGKSVAGKYNISSVSNADDVNAGIIKIANDNELLDNLNNKVAITPYLLNKALSKSAFGELGDIGIAPLGIDESLNLRRYLNGQTIIQDQFKGFTTWLKSRIELYPTLSCTNEEFETACTLSDFGQCGKFVVDDDAGTIRLPKVVNIQGLQEFSNIGNTVEAGLPNITGTIFNISGQSSSVGLSANGAFYLDSPDTSGGYGTGKSGLIDGFTLDASRSSSIYGKSETVQEESIQYPFYIQVATGINETIDTTREIELNNPFFLGQSQYFDINPNNISWLKSEGQWNAKAVHTDYYDWLLRVYNGTEVVEGVNVKLTTEEYTDYDFVVNQDDMTFRLPLLNGSEDLVSEKFVNLELGATGTTYTAPANGFYHWLGAFNTTGQKFYLYVVDSSGNRLLSTGNQIRYSPSSTTYYSCSIPVKRGQTIQVEHSVNSTSEFRFTYAQGNGSLYYYVGDTVQNANIVNIGRIEETMATKTMVDGQWVGSYYGIADGVTAPSGIDNTFTYDLSDYLPNDGYVYEVVLSIQASCRGTVGDVVMPRIGSDIINYTLMEVCGTRQVTTNTSDPSICTGVIICPVGKGRYLQVYNSGNATGTFTHFRCCAYRRIGTNL